MCSEPVEINPDRVIISWLLTSIITRLITKYFIDLKIILLLPLKRKSSLLVSTMDHLEAVRGTTC